MKYRLLNYFGYLAGIYLSLRLLAEFLYIVVCVLAGIVYSEDTMQILKYISLAVAAVVIGAQVILDRREIKRLSVKTEYNAEIVSYALFKMHMSSGSVEETWDLEAKVAEHKAEE